MGCLFGYVGQPRQGLLEQMAGRLLHRCKNGYETLRLEISPRLVVEIGRGIAPWCGKKRVAADEQKQSALGYSGIITNLKKKDIFPPRQLLALLEEHGTEGLKELEGSFVMAYAKKDRFYLLRDAAGIKGVVFASETKALFADPTVKREIRLQALPEYLTFSFVPGKQTMFKDIEELQPGHLLTYADGKVTGSRHFVFEHLEPDEDQPVFPVSRMQEFRSLLEHSVRECCEATAQTPAIFLSGGIDSSAVLALTANLYPGKPIDTFSVHFGPQYLNENSFIEMISQRYKTRHTWMEIQPPRFIKRLNEIIGKLDDPIGDPITVPNYLMAEAASKVTGVVLNGEGGDPCFGGPKNIPMLLAHLYGPPTEQEADNWFERNYLQSYRKCYADLELLLNPDLFSKSRWEESLQEILRPFFRARQPRSFLNKLMTINIRLKGANSILIKVDKMTSANGILALAPLFSKEVIRSSMRLPPVLKLRGNIEKAVLKVAVKDIVPGPIIERPKSGMRVPVRYWFRGEMKRYARQVLSKRKLKQLGFFNTGYVRSLLKYNLNDIHGMRCGTKLWMLITFLLWHEQMMG
jgi:asparagine synthase (glutamine-hydrolysing)